MSNAFSSYYIHSIISFPLKSGNSWNWRKNWRWLAGGHVDRFPNGLFNQPATFNHLWLFSSVCHVEKKQEEKHLDQGKKNFLQVPLFQVPTLPLETIGGHGNGQHALPHSWSLICTLLPQTSFEELVTAKSHLVPLVRHPPAWVPTFSMIRPSRALGPGMSCSIVKYHLWY